MSIIEKNGKVSTTEMDLSVGEPENPATWEDFARKFYTNATTVISLRQAKKLEDTILNLEKNSVQDFTQQLEL